MSEATETKNVAMAKTEEAPFAVVRGIVEAVERVSPSFVRITFGGPELHGIGNPGASLDQRIKLIFPPSSGVLPEFVADSGEWYRNWLAVPEGSRGSMRTYSIRALDVSADATFLTIDFVLHLVPGETGPASNWAATARAGDSLLIVAPRRGRFDGGGIEYRPGDAKTVLLAGDETAAPAIARILEDCSPDTRGVAFVEVPESADELDIFAPAGVEVRWLPRAGSETGTVLLTSVREHLERTAGANGCTAELSGAASGSSGELEPDALLWETPVFSSLGEPVSDTENHADAYFWIAGESGTVTTLRRHLVKQLGIDRSQVAFMGYWRRGVAMRG